MTASTAICASCADLLDFEVANTGRGEHLASAWQKMQRCDLANDVDIGRCPDCDACFEWQDHPQFFGSGNLDEEHLRRLPETEAILVRALLMAPTDPAAPARVIHAALSTVSAELMRVLLMQIAIKYKEAFLPLLPTLVDRLFGNPAFSAIDQLSAYVGWSQPRAFAVIALIEADSRVPPVAVEILLQRCRAVRP